MAVKKPIDTSMLSYFKTKIIDFVDNLISVHNTDIDAHNNLRLNEFTLIDKVTGYEYVNSVSDGQLSYHSKCNGIVVAQMPNKTKYDTGIEFDPTGMIVAAECEDGTYRQITDYVTTVEYEDLSLTVNIEYTENGTTYSTSFTLYFIEYLNDFEYIDNGDGTYTITGWKGTVNGESSTEMIFPNDERVIL